MSPRTKRSGIDGCRPTILELSIFVASLLILSATISPPLAAEESVGEKIKKIFSTPTPTPTPHTRKKSTTAKKESPSPTSSPKKKSVSPSPSAPPSSKAKKTSSPKPAPSETRPPPPTPTPSLSSTATATPEKGKRGAPNATLSPEAITGFENYPPKVQQLLNSALELTSRKIGRAHV